MSTAHIIYGEGGVPVSPRKQGAGLISIHDAVSTKAYLSVSGQMKPKLELKDDPDMTGKYTMTFTVHNTGDTTLYYDITPWVLTDGSTEYTNAEGKTYTTSSETAVVLDHTEADLHSDCGGIHRWRKDLDNPLEFPQYIQ